MGELDDALAGLRADVLAATATDFERVRRARRSLRARRATASALALALIGGGAAFALGGQLGGGGDDSIRYLDPTPTAAPAPSDSGSPVPLPTDGAGPTAPAENLLALDLDGSDGLLLSEKCDGDNIECTLLVRETRDGATTFTGAREVARGAHDPDSVDAVDHLASRIVRYGDVTWLWGPSLFRSTDRSSWAELPIQGFVAGLVRDETGVVAIVERCAATFPTFTDCAIATVDVASGTPRDLSSQPIENGSYVADVAGTPSSLVIQLGQEDGIAKELVGTARDLTLRSSVCQGRAQVRVLAVPPGFTAFCGDQPTGTTQVTERFLLPAASKAWTSAGSTDLRGQLGKMFVTPYGLLALPSRGPVQLSDEGQSWRVVLPEVDGDAVIGLDVSAGDRLTLLSSFGDPQNRPIWVSHDGTHWAGRQLVIPIS